MPTGTLGTTARYYATAQIHYLRKRVTFADAGTTVTVGIIPAGSVMLKPISGVAVHIAFNGDTTNTLDIGPSTDSGTNLWMTIGATDAIAFVPFDEAVSNLVSADTTVQAAVVSTASASAGTADIIIAYVVDHDG